MSDIADIAKDIAACQSKARELQSETIHCIAILPSGKISVVDKERLESLNGEADRLKGLIAHNTDVHDELAQLLNEADLPNLRDRKNRQLAPTVEIVRERKRQVEGSITKTENLFRMDLGDLIKNTHDIDPSTPFAHWKAKSLKEETDAQLAGLRAELAIVDDLLTRASQILKDYRPSGVTASKPDEFRSAITREKTAAAFGA